MNDRENEKYVSLDDNKPTQNKEDLYLNKVTGRKRKNLNLKLVTLTHLKKM